MPNDPLDGTPPGGVRDIRDAAPRTGAARHIAAFVEDPALRPVLFVLIAHAGLAGALVLLAVARAAGPFSVTALLLLLGLSVDGVVRARRRRLVLLWVIGLWTLAVAMAIGGARLGVL